MPKKALFITGLLLFTWLAACSPSVSIHLPTPEPTTIQSLVDPQSYQLMEITDVQGRLVMKNMGNGMYRFFAYQAGIDERVGDGRLQLQAGYSYTFAAYGKQDQVEIRQVSNDELVGYWLPIMDSDPNTGALTAVGKPIAIVDTNADGLVTPQEMEAALSGLGVRVKNIAASQPYYADQFEAEITSATAALNAGSIAGAYRQLKQLQLELTTVEQAIKTQAADAEATTLIVVIGAAALILVLVIFILARRRTVKRLKRFERKPAAPEDNAFRQTGLYALAEAPSGAHPPGTLPELDWPCPYCGGIHLQDTVFCPQTGKRLLEADHPEVQAGTPGPIESPPSLEALPKPDQVLSQKAPPEPLGHMAAKVELPENRSTLHSLPIQPENPDPLPAAVSAGLPVEESGPRHVDNEAIADDPINCPHCGQPHPPDSVFCPFTGSKLIEAARSCPNCSQPLGPGWVHCGYCGHQLLQADSLDGKDHPAVPPPSEGPLEQQLQLEADREQQIYPLQATSFPTARPGQPEPEHDFPGRVEFEASSPLEEMPELPPLGQELPAQPALEASEPAPGLQEQPPPEQAASALEALAESLPLEPLPETSAPDNLDGSAPPAGLLEQAALAQETAIPPSTPDQILCPHCARRHPSDSLFCPTTGKKIFVAEQPVLSVPPRASIVVGQPTPPRSRAPWLRWVLIGGGIALLLSICAIVFFAVWKPWNLLAASPASTADLSSTNSAAAGNVENIPGSDESANPPAILWTATPTVSPTPTLPPTPSLTPSPTPTTIPVTPQLGSTLVSPVDGMVMVYVPEGLFIMGSQNGAAAELKRHKVTLDDFWIDRTEVTNAMYALCVLAGQCPPPSKKSSLTRSDYYGNPTYDNFPVINTYWASAEAYCRWAGRSLPTEAQWEKAARGTDARDYPWGNTMPGCSLLDYSRCIGDTLAVGSFPGGASPYGALDMAGNAWEWVNDWYSAAYYDDTPRINPTGPISGNGRVVRGGGMISTDVDIHVYHRANQSVNSPGPGFRCALSTVP